MGRSRSRLRALAIVLSVLNFGGLLIALANAEPAHAGAHMAVGAGLLLWLRRIREQPVPVDRQTQIEGLEDEVDQLRRELTEAQERLDFTERMLARRPAPRS